MAHFEIKDTTVLLCVLKPTCDTILYTFIEMLFDTLATTHIKCSTTYANHQK